MSGVHSSIKIKGIREGLLVTVGQGSYADIVAQLELELAAKQSFLQGSRITLAVGERPLRREQLAEIQDTFARHRLILWTVLADKEMTRGAARDLELATRLPGSHTDLDGNQLVQRLVAQGQKNPQTAPAESGGLILKETIRSGRSIFHEGHVVIIGDVNPGAEVLAAGDVIVWGRLRGLVHAGATGDETAVICALDLSPTQLRIADQIAIPPDKKNQQSQPEQAAIRNGQIVAESWSGRL